MAETKDFLKELENLCQLDIDAVHAYTEAIDRMDLEDVKERLSAFRSDHQKHIADLSPLIEKLGGTPPKQSVDFKGFLIQGFTALKSMVGNESALKAMKSNEELTNKTYDRALQIEFPEDILAVIRKNRDDERRHLEYIKQCIEARVWERGQKNVA